jgi:hypothetical protein
MDAFEGKPHLAAVSTGGGEDAGDGLSVQELSEEDHQDPCVMALFAMAFKKEFSGFGEVYVVAVVNFVGLEPLEEIFDLEPHPILVDDGLNQPGLARGLGLHPSEEGSKEI